MENATSESRQNLIRVAQGETPGESLEPLPEPVLALLLKLDAPLRLVAHLRAVHHVAGGLLRELEGLGEVDREAILFGAATHDVGKIRQPEELHRSGTLHEESGYRLLLQEGFPENLARFARTHASPSRGTGLEDLLVALADKLWRGRRDGDLESQLAERLRGEREPWESFLALDEVCERLAERGPERLAFQNQFA